MPDHPVAPRRRTTPPRVRCARCRSEGRPDSTELTELHRRFSDHRCPDAAPALVDRYAHHAEAVARRFYRGREPLEDLEQVALEGLLRALERFDPDRGVPFAAFAKPSMAGTVKRFYRDRGWSVSLPRWMHEITPSLRQAHHDLRQEEGREPTVHELAERLGIPVRRIERAMRGAATRETDSLDLATEHRRDPTGTTDRQLESAENRVAVTQVIDLLGTGERELLDMYFGRELTQSEIGARTGVSQVQVSRQLRRVLDRLRAELVSA